MFLKMVSILLKPRGRDKIKRNEKRRQRQTRVKLKRWDGTKATYIIKG